MGLVRLFLGFGGRLSRAEFLIMGVLLAMVEQVASVLATTFVDSRYPASADFALVSPADLMNGGIMLLFLWPMLAMTAKRYHDLDKSGWWSLLIAAPIVLGTLGVVSWMQDAKDTGLALCGMAVIAFIWPIIELGTFHGAPGDNSYGPRLGWKSLLPGLARSLARSEQEQLARLAAQASTSMPARSTAPKVAKRSARPVQRRASRAPGFGQRASAES